MDSKTEIDPKSQMKHIQETLHSLIGIIPEAIEDLAAVDLTHPSEEQVKLIADSQALSLIKRIHGHILAPTSQTTSEEASIDFKEAYVEVHPDIKLDKGIYEQLNILKSILGTMIDKQDNPHHATICALFEHLSTIMEIVAPLEGLIQKKVSKTATLLDEVHLANIVTELSILKDKIVIKHFETTKRLFQDRVRAIPKLMQVMALTNLNAGLNLLQGFNAQTQAQIYCIIAYISYINTQISHLIDEKVTGPYDTLLSSIKALSQQHLSILDAEFSHDHPLFYSLSYISLASMTDNLVFIYLYQCIPDVRVRTFLITKWLEFSLINSKEIIPYLYAKITQAVDYIQQRHSESEIDPFYLSMLLVTNNNLDARYKRLIANSSSETPASRDASKEAYKRFFRDNMAQPAFFTAASAEPITTAAPIESTVVAPT